MKELKQSAQAWLSDFFDDFGRHFSIQEILHQKVYFEKELRRKMLKEKKMQLIWYVKNLQDYLYTPSERRSNEIEIRKHFRGYKKIIKQKWGKLLINGYLSDNQKWDQ